MSGLYRFILRGIHFVLRHLAALDDRIMQKLNQPSNKWKDEPPLPPPMEKDSFFSDIRLITHAGGGLSGLTYLNCAEAYEPFYRAGNRVFEYDVEQKENGDFILAHENNGQDLLDGRFHPMSLRECMGHLQAEKDTVVVFDCKFADLTLFAETVRDMLESADELRRVVIQVFKEENIRQVQAAGAFRMLFVCMQETDYRRAAELCLRNGIGAVSVSVQAIRERTGWQLFPEHNICAFAYTVNRREEYYRLKEAGVQGVFTDFLTPIDIEGAKP